MDLLWVIVIILLVCWLLGAFVVPFGGSFVHLLLVVVILIVIIRLARGERV